MNNITLMTNYLLGKMRRIYFMALPETKQDFKKSRRAFTVGDSAAQTIAQLSGGTFLVGLMAHVGISDSNIGVITSLASLAAISQLFVMGLTNKFKKYKLFVCLTVMQRILLSLIYFIPLFGMGQPQKAALLIGCYFFAQICVQIGTPATQDWIASLVPSRLRGRYLSIKDSVAVFVVAAVMLAAGVMVDFFKKSDIEIGFILIGIMIFILVVINVAAFSCMKEPKMASVNEKGLEMHGKIAKKGKTEAAQAPRGSLRAELAYALKSKNFRAAFILNLLWMTSFYICSPFNSSYQIKELALPYTFLMLMGFICNLYRIYITPKIGRMGDKRGMAVVLKYFILALGIQYLIFVFSVPGNAVVMTIIGNIIGSTAWAFIGIGNFAIQLDFVDRKRRMTQLTLISSISGIYGFAVSYVGGCILGFLQKNPVELFGHNLYAQQVLNVIGFVLVIVTFLYIKFVVQKIKIQTNRQDGKV